MSLRILVLDECGLQRCLLERLCPPGTELVALTSFEEAMRLVREDPPDAAVVSVPPAEVPWREFQSACARAASPVPVLYECLAASALETWLEPHEGDAIFLRKPATRTDLERSLDRLLAIAREARASAPSIPAVGG